MEAGDNRLSRLRLPMYSYGESDFLAHVSRGTSRRWLAGYTYRTDGGALVTQPPVTIRSDADTGVSFIDLIEIVAIGRLKEIGHSLPAIRRVVQNCQEFLGVERPFATLKFKAGGRAIFVSSAGGVLVEMGRRKVLTAWDEVLAPFLEELDYLQDIVSRWWPMGKTLPIVVDPDYGHGLPVIAESGVRTELVYERFRAGA